VQLAASREQRQLFHRWQYNAAPRVGTLLIAHHINGLPPVAPQTELVPIV
jgi:hypothetical protein